MEIRSFVIHSVAVAFAATAYAVAPANSAGSTTREPRLTLTPSCDPGREANAAKSKELSEDGKTSVRFKVSANGQLQKAEVAISSGSRSLDTATLSALSRCQFSPALDDKGNAVTATFIVDYAWQLH